jgi:hypothetical protein
MGPLEKPMVMCGLATPLPTMTALMKSASYGIVQVCLPHQSTDQATDGKI